MSFGGALSAFHMRFKRHERGISLHAAVSAETVLIFDTSPGHAHSRLAVSGLLSGARRAGIIRLAFNCEHHLMKPVIALVGRPNVGKSTLFNRLTRSRDALVADLPTLPVTVTMAKAG